MLSSQAIQKISKDILQFKKDPIDGMTIIASDALSELKCIINAPNSTPYENGQFMVRFHFETDFPSTPPKAYFITKIFHPNVDIKTGEICVNTLKKDWNSNLGLRHILLIIRCLMIEPNPDSALNAEAGHLLHENYDLFVAKARMFTQIHAQKRLDTTTLPNCQSNQTAQSTQGPMTVKKFSNRLSISCNSDCEGVLDSKENLNSSNQSPVISSDGSNTTCNVENQIIHTMDDSLGTPTGLGGNSFKKVKKSAKMKRGLRRL